jgi:hypothetical protein
MNGGKKATKRTILIKDCTEGVGDNKSRARVHWIDVRPSPRCECQFDLSPRFQVDVARPDISVGAGLIPVDVECRLRKGYATQPFVRGTICLRIIRNNDQIEVGAELWIAPRPRTNERKSAQIIPFSDPASDKIDKHFCLVWCHIQTTASAISSLMAFMRGGAWRTPLRLPRPWQSVPRAPL